MTMAMLQEFLGWCSVINMGLLLFSALMVCILRDRVCRLHGKFYDLPAEKIKALLYAVMAYYKISIFIFNLVPYFALRIMSS